MNKAKESKIVSGLKEDVLNYIEKTMQEEGISQAELARRMDAERININKILKQRVSATLDFLIKMAEHLNLEIEIKIRKK
jgi:transcriptional regulator with XRE-family HTH domain